MLLVRFILWVKNTQLTVFVFHSLKGTGVVIMRCPTTKILRNTFITVRYWNMAISKVWIIEAKKLTVLGKTCVIFRVFLNLSIEHHLFCIDTMNTRWGILKEKKNIGGGELFFSPTRWNLLRIWPSLFCRQAKHRWPSEWAHIAPNLDRSSENMKNLKNFPNVSETCDICNPVWIVLKWFEDF